MKEKIIILTINVIALWFVLMFTSFKIGNMNKQLSELKTKVEAMERR